MKLKEWIKETEGMTQERLAEMAGCSQPSIARVIAGGNATTDLIKAISEATGGQVTPNDIMLGEKAA